MFALFNLFYVVLASGTVVRSARREGAAPGEMYCPPATCMRPGGKDCLTKLGAVAPAQALPSVARAVEVGFHTGPCRDRSKKCGAPRPHLDEPDGAADSYDGDVESGGSLLEVLAGAELQMACSGIVAKFTGQDWNRYEDLFGETARENQTRHFSNQSLSECKTSNKNVLWLYPEEDHNEAFQMDWSVCQRLLGWSDAACSVHVWRVRSVQDATQIVWKYPKDSLMAVVLGGHGSEGSPDMQWGANEYCGTGYLCGEGRRSKTFLRHVLGPRLARHGTVFLDSCYGASNGLAEIISDNIGKGITVIGGDDSFSTVTVGRFGVGHEVTDLDGANVEEFHAVGASCPGWAQSTQPDEDGDCECPHSTTCRVKDGGKCPVADGRWSRTRFDPACATFGTCRCQ